MTIHDDDLADEDDNDEPAPPVEDIDDVEVIEDPEPIDDDDEVMMLERALELAREKRDSEPKPNRAQRRGRRRSGLTAPAHAPKPKDRQSKKSAQQDEAEDSEIVITAFGDEFRVRRSSLQDNWRFFAAAAVGNLPSMLASMLGNAQFARFCQKAMEDGMKPNQAATEMMNLISKEMGVTDSGNS